MPKLVETALDDVNSASHWTDLYAESDEYQETMRAWDDLWSSGRLTWDENDIPRITPA